MCSSDLGLFSNEGTCEMETTAQRDSSRLLTKMDSNAAKYCRHNDDGGQGYVILVVFYLCTDLIFFTNTVQRVLLLIRSIWVGKLFTVFILLLGRSEVILTSRLLSQLLNLECGYEDIERGRIIEKFAGNFFFFFLKKIVFLLYLPPPFSLDKEMSRLTRRD